MSVIERFEEHATLFGRMAQRHGVDWQRASGIGGGLALRRAIGLCMACRETDTCRDDPETAVAQGLCPNAPRFRAWAGDVSAD